MPGTRLHEATGLDASRDCQERGFARMLRPHKTDRKEASWSCWEQPTENYHTRGFTCLPGKRLRHTFRKQVSRRRKPKAARETKTQGDARDEASLYFQLRDFTGLPEMRLQPFLTKSPRASLTRRESSQQTKMHILLHLTMFNIQILAYPCSELRTKKEYLNIPVAKRIRISCGI